MGADQIPGTARRIIRPTPRWSNPLPTCSTPMTIARTRNHELPAYACGVSPAKISTAKLRAMSHGQNVNVGGNGMPPRNRRMRRTCGLYHARKSCVASSAMCNPRARVAATHGHPNAVVELPVIKGARMSPNENKMSDGRRERALIEVEMWKSSQKWSVRRSAVRSIAWLGGIKLIAAVAGMCQAASSIREHP